MLLAALAAWALGCASRGERATSVRVSIARGGAVAECWHREVSRYPDHPTEHITVRARITREGRARDVVVDGAQNLRLPVCIRAELPRMDFGRGREVSVAVAMTLSPRAL